MNNQTTTTPQNPIPSSEMVRAAMSKSSVAGTMAGLKRQDIGTILEAMKPQIAQALPKHLTADRIIQMTVTLIHNNQKIAQCSVASLVGAVMQSSILGFEPVSALGQCYFVPYGKDVQFQIGYRGFIKLAQNSKEVKNLYAEVVRAGDKFEYELGLEPKLRHVPNLDAEGAITHAYAVAHLMSGGYVFAVLTKKQIEGLRMRSPSQKNGLSGAWSTDYDEMAKAKAIKKLAKYLPLSVDMAKAVASDESVITEKAWSDKNEGINLDAVNFDNYSEVKEEVTAVSEATVTEQPTVIVEDATDLFNSKKGAKKS